KLGQTRIVKRAAALATAASGAAGTLAGDDALDAGIYSKAMVFSAASSIYGGADEIQRNIVAERSLGLPREPNPDNDLPYGEVLRGRCRTDERTAREAATDRRRDPAPHHHGGVRRGRLARSRARAHRAVRGVTPVAARGAAHPRGRRPDLGRPRGAGRRGRA